MGELKADLKGPFKGVVIESKKERTRGISATVLVKNGTLKLGDQIIGEKISGKVKSMISDSGENVSVAEVSQPVSVSGWEGLPAVGVEVTLWRGKIDFNTITPKRKVTPLETEQKRLNLILRADSWGSLEAILGVLPPDVRVIQSDVGEICESDVLMAKTFSAIIFGFNLKISGSILKLAETEKVKVKTYRVIYDLLKEVEDEVLWMVDPMAGREVLGKAEVIAEFEIRGERIAGARVFSGRIDKADKSCILRSERIMAETSIKSMRHGKEEISQAGMNLEFGAIFSPPVDFQKGDVIISYINKA
jgi:translation initiation factor IF-2